MSTANPLIDYYKDYYQRESTKAYVMDEHKDYSRVLLLKEWIEKHTPENGRILDIGCGDMTLAKLMPQYKWSGIDINNEKAPEAVVHDLMATPYPFVKSEFDTIVCTEVLEHLWDMRVVHKEAYRLLKKGGYYAISTPNFDWIDHIIGDYRHLLFDTRRIWTLEHIRQYNLPTHKHYLGEANFTVVDACGADAHFGTFFQNARYELKKALPDKPDGEIDLLLGKMFRECSHTIALLSRKEV